MYMFCYSESMLVVGGTIAKWHSLPEALHVNAKLGGKYIPCMSMSKNKGFYLLNKGYEPSMLPPDLCLCEMVIDNTARMFIDFDYDIQDNMSAISLSIRCYLKMMYNVDVRLCWKWSKRDTIRWHCIISGIYFKGCWKEACIHMSNMLRIYMPYLVIDDCVYRNNSSLRICYQRKYYMGQYVKRLQPYANYNTCYLSINADHEDICITMDAYQASLNKHIFCNGCRDIECPCNSMIRRSAKGTNGLDNKTHEDVVKICIDHPFVVPSGMKLDKIVGQLDSTSIHRLVRVAPSMCMLCNRIHTSENSYIIVSPSTVEVRCYRNPKDKEGRNISLVFRRF